MLRQHGFDFRHGGARRTQERFIAKGADEPSTQNESLKLLDVEHERRKIVVPAYRVADSSLACDRRSRYH